MDNRIRTSKSMPIFYAAVLSSTFFWSLVLLDRVMEKMMSASQRIAVSHFFLVLAVLLILSLLPGGLATWGLDFKEWQKSLIIGIISGIGVGILFSLFSYGWSISGWNFSKLMSQLNKTETLTQLFSQLFLVGTSEELFFRGLLTTWLMKRYSSRLAGLSAGVFIVAFLFAFVQFYKMLFGFSPGNVMIFVLGAFLYGLLLGGMYQKTKSLLAPILIHNLGNSVMFLASLGI